MNALKVTELKTVNELELPCRVVIFYEDAAARQNAFDRCEQLRREFSGDVSFELDWWRMSTLTSPVLAQLAEEAVADADVVIFSFETANLPEDIHQWLETWQSPRSKADGAMAIIVNEPIDPCARDTVFLPLQTAAAKRGLDFLQPTGRPCVNHNHKITPLPLSPPLM